MKKNILLVTLIFGLTLGAAAKDCPSRLYSNLHSLGSSPLYWAFELRGFNYIVDGTNYFYQGLGGLLHFEPSENFFIDIEGVYRPKKYRDCTQADELSAFQLKTLSLNYFWKGPGIELMLGRQQLLEGSGLVLNDFFDAMTIDFTVGNFDISLGAGILALQVAMESLYCQKCFFYEYKSGWKGFCNSEYGDYKTAFINIARRFGTGNNLALLYLKTLAKDESFSSDTFSLNSKVRLPIKLNLVTELVLQRLSQSGNWTHGLYLEIYKSWRFRKAGNLTLKLQNLYGSSNDNILFTPVFGNVYLGDRQHYSIRQGNILGVKAKFTPAYLKAVSINAAYYVSSKAYFSEFLTDEINLGLELRLFRSEKIRFKTVYSRAMTPEGPVNQFRLDTRINL